MNKKGYFNLEQSLITVGIVVVSLLLIKILFPTFLFGAVGSSAEPYELTGSDVRGYISDLENLNNRQEKLINEQYGDLFYWSNLDQAEEIKKLQKRPAEWVVILTTGLWLIFYVAFFVMLSKNDDKKNKIWQLELKLNNIKNTLYSKNRKKITMMKKLFEDKNE